MMDASGGRPCLFQRTWSAASLLPLPKGAGFLEGGVFMVLIFNQTDVTRLLP